MKFSTYLREIAKVEIFPVISLILFISIFVLVVVYVFGKDKTTMDQRARLPLE